jgi:hypothetical protein
MKSICNFHVSLHGDGPPNHRYGYSCGKLKDHAGDHSPYPESYRQGLEVSPGLLEIQEKIYKAKLTLSKLYTKEKKAKKTVLITCLGWTVGFGQKGCGAQFPVETLEYIQTHWYTSPYSCTGGDYWSQGEGQFICPKCGSLNRLYERPEVESLKESFASVKDTYDS